ncbi:hypothetical protein C0971_09715 [Bacillus methanolicus]|uniref:hypothetical protein n=1 Tax=Bacillus methanolicus TaxID=1471 RepID=UPI00200CC793|nr:hypothetical protein [Bacillus methanolicus]UQD52259.1 hypothetical protein C0971_09715 [Bacillus methanolicus]
MDALVVGLLFLIPGIIFFLFVLFKYTELEHQKELEKWRWFREDNWKWIWDPELALFTKIAEKSFFIAKVILLLTALIPVSIGALALWAYFAG